MKTRRESKLARTPEHKAWRAMRVRCTNPASAAYANYGGRGIRVCDRWINSFDAFLADVGHRPSPAYELDRKNNDGNYEPGNCRWVTRSVNDRNRRSNRFLEFRGERLTVAEWCERFELSQGTVNKRLKKGWSVEDALTRPLDMVKSRNARSNSIDQAEERAA